MKYLLTAIDVANSKLNQIELSCYGDSAYATQNAADTDTVITAVDTLVQRAEFPFHFTPAVESNEYMFTLTAVGKYVVDWGDGTGECIDKTDVNDQIISHTYASPAKNYRIGFGGKATGYIRWGNMAKSVIYFGDESSRLSSIDGCVGCVFSTITDANGNIWKQGDLGGQPSFAHMFSGNSELRGEIPPNLFDGIHGALLNYMFEDTFSGCSGLTGSIPENLFAGIDGPPASLTFRDTFSGCSGLTGEIPENLFAGIKGKPTSWLFAGTFSGCSGLTGPIPEKLFAGISGAPVPLLFSDTFSGCTGLTSIPENLFAGIDSTADTVDRMFYGTFSGCTGLTGYSPKINGKYLYEIWPSHNSVAYHQCTGLADYADMPAGWR